ncbi:major facilitator superfamily domain-containing protein [Podospora didyma]|uniref:Major facilitator superfamily domain-containing protein n=1 Tax=Podospora didyma TaxID=330526 RepID=A0AAE0P5F9_9PEZI|nr:major facilitator superfamily domain-containing protein [Podospora didyma]
MDSAVTTGPFGMAGSINDSPTPAAAAKDSGVMTGFPLYAILFSMCVGSFLMSTDVFIISTAIPSITIEFRDTTQLAWYPAAYSLTTCAIIPLAGKISSVFSLRWIYQGLFFIFLLGSVVCGAATSSNMFIVGRALAGMGASGVASGGLTIILTVSSPAKRPLFMSMGSNMFALDIILVPIIGGAFAEKVTWRWCFWINLPAGAVTLASMFFFFHPPPVRTDKAVLERVRDLDLVGCVIFIPAIFILLKAMKWGGTKYLWNSPTIIGLFVGGGVLMLVFVSWEWRVGDAALIPGVVLTRRAVVLACVFAFCQLGSMAVMSYYLPEYFPVVQGVSPLESGVRVLPSIISQLGGIVVVGVFGKWYSAP